MVYFNTRGSLDGAYPPRPFAAIVVDVNSDQTVGLAVFGSTGIRFEQNVRQGDLPGCWDWMPFQKDQQARLAPGTSNDSHVGTKAA